MLFTHYDHDITESMLLIKLSKFLKMFVNGICTFRELNHIFTNKILFEAKQSQCEQIHKYLKG